MQVKISLLYNQFLARTNVALTSRMPCNSPYIFNYPLEYLAHWLFFGKFLSRASNTTPRVRSPRPFCPCLHITYSPFLRYMSHQERCLHHVNVLYKPSYSRCCRSSWKSCFRTGCRCCSSGCCARRMSAECRWARWRLTL